MNLALFSAWDSLNLNLRSEVLEMHSLCRRPRMHLAVAGPRLKRGVGREDYSGAF